VAIRIATEFDQATLFQHNEHGQGHVGGGKNLGERALARLNRASTRMERRLGQREVGALEDA
jgi:hypothetical protein